MIALGAGHSHFEDEERFFLPAVNVRRWTAAGRHDGLEHGVFPVRLFSRCEEAVHVADDADATTFAVLSDGRWVLHVHGLVLG